MTATNNLTVADGLNLAQQSLAARKYNDVVGLCRQILQVEAQNPHALHMLSIVANKTGKPERALEIAERARASRPNDPAILNTLGLILAKLDRLDDAEERFRESLLGDDGQKQTWLNLAAMKERQNKFAVALDILADLEKRVGVDPAIFSLRATVLQSKGDFDGALELLETALRSAPNDVDIRFARANVLLLLGRMGEGWPDFELRRHRDLGREPPIGRPVWPGLDGPRARLLVYAEHGLGDVIQFSRYVPCLIECGLDVTFACYPELMPLMRFLTPASRLISVTGDMPDCDYVAPLMSVPRLLGHGLQEIAEIGKTCPYLSFNLDAAARIRSELEDFPGIKVGLTWQGNPGQSTDKDRSIPIAHFEPIMKLDRVTIVSLQKGAGERDIEPFKDQYAIVDRTNWKDGLETTAQLIQALDLVITSDTAIAHLSGALARPTWLLLSAKPSWRWLLDRHDSPWYPTLRLFRQRTFRDWAPVFEEVVAALGRGTWN